MTNARWPNAKWSDKSIFKGSLWGKSTSETTEKILHDKGGKLSEVIGMNINKFNNFLHTSCIVCRYCNTVTTRCSAAAYNKISSKAHTVYFYSYLQVCDKENLCIEHNFNQSFEMRYSGGSSVL